MSEKRLYSWTYKPGQELILSREGTTLFCYHFATDRQKPYLHPVYTPDTILLTCLEPWDHVWHRGIWFSWKYLNGANYWEETEEGSGGITELAGAEKLSLGMESATVSTQLHYRPVGGAVVLEEQRVITFYLPRPDGSYVMDWHLTFKARGEPVVIDRTPINEETPWGGYAGLSWRAARSLGNFRAIDSEGRRDHAVEHQRARWVDLSGASDGGWHLAAGVAMFDHPSNPRYPTHWRCILEPGFGYINPAFVLAEPYILPAGETLNLLYRVLIHPGWGNTQLLEEEFQRFSR